MNRPRRKQSKISDFAQRNSTKKIILILVAKRNAKHLMNTQAAV